MKKVIIGQLVSFIPVACYALAGMMDRYLEMMEVLYAVLKTIFVSQLVVFLLISFNWLKSSKRIRKKLLFFAKRLCKNWCINLLAAWALSSFVLIPYIFVFCMGAFILAIIPFFILGVLYLVVVFRKKMRARLLSGLRALYFYLIASIGQILVFIVLFLANIIMLYGPINTFTNYLWDIYCYRVPLGNDGGYIIAKGIWDLSLFMAIPYLLLILYNTRNRRPIYSDIKDAAEEIPEPFKSYSEFSKYMSELEWVKIENEDEVATCSGFYLFNCRGDNHHFYEFYELKKGEKLCKYYLDHHLDGWAVVRPESYHIVDNIEGEYMMKHWVCVDSSLIFAHESDELIKFVDGKFYTREGLASFKKGYKWIHWGLAPVIENFAKIWKFQK